MAGWNWVGSSADGTHLAAVSLDDAAADGIYISTNSGVTWSQHLQTNEFEGGAISADGRTLLAWGAFDVFASTNFGSNWTPVTPLNWADYYNFHSATITADGSKWAAYGEDINLTWFEFFSSTNQGASWDQIDGPPSSSSDGELASSAEGGRLVIALDSVGIYVSTNFGVTWQQSDALVNSAWRSVACSTNGTRMVACARNALNLYIGALYISSDSGRSWTQADAPETNWIAVASSADGSKLFAAARRGGIYAWQAEPPPLLSVETSGSGVIVSWLVDSRFVLQQTAALGSLDWTDVTATPVVESGFSRVILKSPPGGASFFRLKGL
jgi:hypothetical protein